MSDIPEDIRPIVDRICSTQHKEPIGKRSSKTDALARLSQSIWDYFQRNKDARKHLERKMKQWKDIEPHFCSKIDCDLKVTGYRKLGADGDMDIFMSYSSLDSLGEQVMIRLLLSVDKLNIHIQTECCSSNCSICNYLSGEVDTAIVPVLVRFQDGDYQCSGLKIIRLPYNA